MNEETESLIKEAMKSIIKMNSWDPITLSKEDESAADAAEDTLQTDPVPSGWIYILNHISAYEEGTQVSASLQLGFVSGGIYHVLKKEKPDEDMTAHWDGQIILREGDYVKAIFTNTTSGDNLKLFANGYRIFSRDR